MSAQLGAYEPFANATLSVDVAVAPLQGTTVTGWITDPTTGNLIPNPVSVGTTPSPISRRVYKAHLHLARTPQLSGEAGVDSTTFVLEGMLLDPWQFDELIQPNQIFNAVFNGLNGKYELHPQQSMMPEFKSVLGTRLSGIFRMAGAGQTS
jgi:hypothetical protein